MKRIVEILIFLSVIVGFSQNEESFKRANSHYNKEKYQEAVNAYQSILEAGQESASLYYNLANAHYKLNNIGSSIFYYEKALILAPNDEDIENNLTYAQKTTIDKIEVLPQGFISRMIRKFTKIFSLDGWAWLSVISIILFVALLILYYTARTSSKKRLFFTSAWVVLIIGIASVFFAFKQYDFLINNRFAIIYAQEITVKSEPNLRSNTVFELHEGTKVQVLETINDWKKIKLADGKIGWIPKTELQEL
ncbi:tetratricopeptide repeat protein [Aquimarina sp. I32.4]|uniref:tetratricopeptide repeat protein n=1 Tax=Aquimarina sp. I32.4 TaxID=2053903 RepID=UPI000CDEC9E2|nr:tetratricopeptide repeat protein [Aquimarina sp. I32.4]